MEREDTEPRMDVIVTLSKNGYVKRVPMDTYKKQNRGGKGVKGQRMTKDDDIAHHLLSGNTHDYILFFTDKGKVLLQGFLNYLPINPEIQEELLFKI